MVKPNEISETAVRTHAIIVRSYAIRVRSSASAVESGKAAAGPVFSRDGEWIVFADNAANALKRISAGGGPALTICALNGSFRGATWGPDDTIIFATDRSKGLMRVPAGGGTPERVTTAAADKGESDHFWPDMLPDGRAVLAWLLGRVKRNPCTKDKAQSSEVTWEARAVSP